MLLFLTIIIVWNNECSAWTEAARSFCTWGVGEADAGKAGGTRESGEGAARGNEGAWSDAACRGRTSETGVWSEEEQGPFPSVTTEATNCGTQVSLSLPSYGLHLDFFRVALVCINSINRFRMLCKENKRVFTLNVFLITEIYKFWSIIQLILHTDLHVVNVSIYMLYASVFLQLNQLFPSDVTWCYIDQTLYIFIQSVSWWFGQFYSLCDICLM